MTCQRRVTLLSEREHRSTMEHPVSSRTCRAGSDTRETVLWSTCDSLLALELRFPLLNEGLSALPEVLATPQGLLYGGYVVLEAVGVKD